MSEKVNRRAFLGAAAVAPISAHMVSEDAKLRMMRGSLVGNDQLVDRGVAVGVEEGPRKFTSFAKWLVEFGRDELMERAQHGTDVDPDIVEMRLPLATKMRMMQKRRYARLVRQNERIFARAVEQTGFFTWWAS